MKKIISILVATALLCVGTVGTASARGRVRFPWAGAAIALGTIGFLAALSQMDAQAHASAGPEAVYPPDGDRAPGWRPYDDGRYRDDPPGHDRPALGRRDLDDRGACRDRDGFRDDGCGDRAWVPGRWVTVRVWVPGGVREVWEPGCHDRHGRWVPGRFVRRHDPGRSVERRVWQEERHRY